MEVMVAVDGSSHADAAVDWATDAAHRHDAVLRIVHVQRHPSEGDLAQDVVAAAGARARARLAPERVETQQELVSGRSVSKSLLGHVGDAEMVVVGARGRGGFAGLLLGSVSQQVAAHADVPVVVIPDPSRTPSGAMVSDPDGDGRRALVTGVDGSTGSGAALSWALEEAAVAGRGLVALHAYRSIRDSAPRDSVAGMSRSQVAAMDERARAIARETVQAVVASTRGPRQDVDVEVVVEAGPPVEVLIRHAEHAGSTLVVGRRGDASLPGARLGSISQACLRHANGPVVVVPRR